jgi:hypothetical protein
VGSTMTTNWRRSAADREAIREVIRDVLAGEREVDFMHRHRSRGNPATITSAQRIDR